MSKRNITYIKPEEPTFLKKLKKQVGYKEGPTVDTKREDLVSIDEQDLLDRQEEEPTVVVLKPGDLTAEEAAEVKKQLSKEIEDTPADIAKRIIFKVPQKDTATQSELKGNKKTTIWNYSKRSKKVQSNLLSFEEEQNDN